MRKRTTPRERLGAIRNEDMTITGNDLANLVQAVALLLTAIGSIASVIVGIRNSRKIENVHQTTNSKMDAMLDLATKAAKAEGKEEGRIERAVVDAATAKIDRASDAAFDRGKHEAADLAAVEGNVAEKRIATATEELVVKDEKK